MGTQHKYETLLTNFWFNSFHQTGQSLVQWYRLDESDDEISGVGMDLNREIKQLEAFFLKMSDNFSVKNYPIVLEDEALYVSDYELVPNDKLFRPRFLILRNAAKLDRAMSACMEIQLLAPNGSIQKLTDLPFPIIGEII